MKLLQSGMADFYEFELLMESNRDEELIDMIFYNSTVFRSFRKFLNSMLIISTVFLSDKFDRLSLNLVISLETLTRHRNTIMLANKSLIVE